MNIQIACSRKASPEDAAREIHGKLQHVNARLLLFFASTKHEPRALGREMKRAFPDATVFGCTTAGEIISGRMLNNTVVCMALDGVVIKDSKVEVLQNLKKDPRGAVEKAFRNFESHFKTPMKDMDFSRYAGIVLVDGLSGMEERLMDRIGDLTNVHFVGGSAGDDLRFKQTHVFFEGEAYADAALLCVIKPGVPFDVLKTQSFKILDKRLQATRVNESCREVLEFNHQPAVQAYADAVGTDPGQISEFFMSNPVGLIADGEPYVRSPQRGEGSKLVFYCNVPAGAELSLLQSGDIVNDTKQVLERKRMSFGPISGIINFHCILRTLALQKTGQLNAYGKLFKHVPTIGFSTYGEQYLGHINQTSTMLIFGESCPEKPEAV